jgi:thiamine phosphate synthase YjbQ (UPF0047 family)
MRFTTRKALTLGNAMHITAGVFINDDESGLHHDYEKWLEGLALMHPSANTGTTAPAKLASGRPLS